MSFMFLDPGVCSTCGGSLGNYELQMDLTTHANKWDCINELQKKLKAATSHLLIAIADAESLAAALKNERDPYAYDKPIEDELKRHEACAKIYKAEGG
jgi:hypothetical protein